MAVTLRAEWNALRRSRPGRRFQERYEASRKKKSEVTLVSRLVRWILAVVAAVIGVVLVFIPGPAFVFFIIAGSLLASESRHVARACDWTELKCRAVARWMMKTWQGLSLPGKCVVVVIAGALAAGAGLLVYRHFFG